MLQSVEVPLVYDSCMYTHSASYKARTYIKSGLKKNFLYILLIAKLNAHIRDRCTFPYKKKKKEKKEPE